MITPRFMVSQYVLPHKLRIARGHGSKCQNCKLKRHTERCVWCFVRFWCWLVVSSMLICGYICDAIDCHTCGFDASSTRFNDSQVEWSSCTFVLAIVHQCQFWSTNRGFHFSKLYQIMIFSGWCRPRFYNEGSLIMVYLINMRYIILHHTTSYYNINI